MERPSWPRTVAPGLVVRGFVDGRSRSVPRAERLLGLLSLVLSDVRYGLGAYLGVYLLTEHGWDPASIGYALSFGGLTGLLAQAPLSAMVDGLRAKRLLLACAVLVVTGTCLAIPLAPRFWPVAAAGIVGALAGVTIGPTLAAISLGIVGPDRFARRACRNEALFHLGNGCINVLILLAAPVFGTPVLFWAMAATGLASVVAAFLVPERAIDHRVARGLPPQPRPSPSADAAPFPASSPALAPASAAAARAVPLPLASPAWRVLRSSRPLLVFAGCGALFNLANGAMLGLLAQKLALGNPGQGIALTAASAIAAQSVMVPAAALAGLRADRWGRKPLLLAAFLALTLRGTLYAVLADPVWLIGGQLLDGVAAGLLGALFPVVVADLTRGAGCFNAAQGAVGTLQDIGGVLSGAVAGWTVVRVGYDATFLALAACAALGAALLWWAMPETARWGAAGTSSPDPAITFLTARHGTNLD